MRFTLKWLTISMYILTWPSKFNDPRGGEMNANCDPAAICPNCESEYVIRIHRSLVEKWVTTKCKYKCTDCGRQFFILKPGVLTPEQKPLPPSESFFHFFRS